MIISYGLIQERWQVDHPGLDPDLHGLTQASGRADMITASDLGRVCEVIISVRARAPLGLSVAGRHNTDMTETGVAHAARRGSTVARVGNVRVNVRAPRRGVPVCVRVHTARPGAWRDLTVWTCTADMTRAPGRPGHRVVADTAAATPGP